MPLALAIATLLFAQWPLRDAVGAGSTQANDLAQWLFALYVAFAVGHAQQRAEHLVARPDLAAKGSRLRRAGAALCVLPWATWLASASVAPMWRSVVSAERFPESFNPGYFLIKIALVLMATLMAWQAAAELADTLRRPARA